MKKVNDILKHLQYSPAFKKINSNKKLDNLIEILPLKLKKGIKFAYIKNNILFFVLTHPVYKMEFKYNQEIIKSLLKKANITNASDVQFFITNKIEKQEIKELKKPIFQERSHAIFGNNIQDKNLNKKFEEIRDIIKTIKQSSKNS